MAGGIVVNNRGLSPIMLLSGALNGAISGGISGYYGSRYPIERVLANSVAGGVSSATNGGRFEDGFKKAAVNSLLTYGNVRMRNAQIELSLKDPQGRSDGTGWSAGLFGDGFKLGGGRFDPEPRDAGCSPLGCWQKGPGSVLGIPYEKGGLVDMVVESFAGPHDAANQRWFYNDLGYIRKLTDRESFIGEYFGNYSSSLLFAAPFAAAAIREQTNYGAYGYGKR